MGGGEGGEKMNPAKVCLGDGNSEGKTMLYSCYKSNRQTFTLTSVTKCFDFKPASSASCRKGKHPFNLWSLFCHELRCGGLPLILSLSLRLQIAVRDRSRGFAAARRRLSDSLPLHVRGNTRLM